MSGGTYVHPTAEVSERATIGDGTKIWHQAQVREGAVLGKGCIVGKGAYVDKDVRIGGGFSTVRQYLEAKLVDERHPAMSPVLLGRGEPMFAGLDWRALGYRVVETTPGEKATHIVIARAS